MKIKYPSSSYAHGILQIKKGMYGCQPFQTYSLIHHESSSFAHPGSENYLYLGQFVLENEFSKIRHGFFLLSEIIDEEKLQAYLKRQEELFSRKKNNIIDFKRK